MRAWRTLTSSPSAWYGSLFWSPLRCRFLAAFTMHFWIICCSDEKHECQKQNPAGREPDGPYLCFKAQSSWQSRISDRAFTLGTGPGSSERRNVSTNSLNSDVHPRHDVAAIVLVQMRRCFHHGFIGIYTVVSHQCRRRHKTARLVEFPLLRIGVLFLENIHSIADLRVLRHKS